MPKDEAIEYVLREFGYSYTIDQARNDQWLWPKVTDHARLIQQYERDRLKPAVDVAAEEYVKAVKHPSDNPVELLRHFKAGAAWQKENGK